MVKLCRAPLAEKGKECIKINQIIEKLHQWGCNTELGMERMVDDDEFYVECLRDLVNDRYFAVLGEALRRGDVDCAFDAAHTLKGVIANLELTPLYNKIVEIVEPLRAGHGEGLSDKYDKLLELREHLIEILNEK